MYGRLLAINIETHNMSFSHTNTHVSISMNTFKSHDVSNTGDNLHYHHDDSQNDITLKTVFFLFLFFQTLLHTVTTINIYTM